MEYFLERIAGSLKNEFGNNLNHHCLVFPGRRAGLYFLRHLAAGIDKPMWAPPVLTINELFRSYSGLQIAGNEILLFEIYKIYRRIKKSKESFDDFYYWGDMLLNDFDDVDKYMVDASMLFSNVNDIKNIDRQFGGLTDDQKEIIKRFWVNFEIEKNTDEKSEFTDLWSILNNLYNEFRNSLRTKNLAYEGMIFRDIAESSIEWLNDATQWEMVHFIGFNALNKCERKLMTMLKQAGKARFYWDYDNSYIKKGNFNSAGHFMRENLDVFGNDMPPDWKYDTMLSVAGPMVTRRVIETSSDVAQVKLIPELIAAIPDLVPGNAHQTAVILADENLLMPVLTSLPENTGDINITMGYPLKQTLVYTFIRHLMDLQGTARVSDSVARFGSSIVLNILKHSLMESLLLEKDIKTIDEIIRGNISRVPSTLFTGSENLEMVFTKINDPVSLSGWFRNILSLIAGNNSKDDLPENSVQRNILNEFIYRIVLSINKLDSIIADPEIIFTPETYMKILDRMLRMQSVPFSGEPLSGIQIMGILETRALDFKNLIIISVNEGVLPAISSSSSSIPYSLREAFGLPSVNHQESIFAYHFYRLLQRAENVTLTYNSNSEGLRSGEMSRFLIQMNYDKILKPVFSDFSFDIRSQAKISELIERSEEMTSKLISLFTGENGRALSPSAINTWLNCRMKFYFRYIKGLKEPDNISGEIDPGIFGNILHEILRKLYHDFTGKTLSVETLDRLLKSDELLRASIIDSIREKFRREQDGYVDGNELIIREILYVFVKRILQADLSLAPFTILNLEDTFSFPVVIRSGDKDLQIRIGGIADRVDIVGGTTRIVDYKTGIVSDKISSMEELFTNDRKKDHDGWLQTLIYCEAYLAGGRDIPLRPSIYKVRKIAGRDFFDKLKFQSGRNNELIIDDYRIIRNEFLSGLRNVLTTIFDPGEPFIMTKDNRMSCLNCPYKNLCLR